MPGPDAYPEMILAAAQDEIRELARARSRVAARRSRRRARGGLLRWRRRPARNSPGRS